MASVLITTLLITSLCSRICEAYLTDLSFDTFTCTCGRSVADSSHLFSFETPQANSKYNITTHHRTVALQTFTNPQGNIFELLTFRYADVLGASPDYSEESWWPSYSWKVAVCPTCHSHLGWIFSKDPADSEPPITEVHPPHEVIEQQYPSRFYALRYNMLDSTEEPILDITCWIVLKNLSFKLFMIAKKTQAQQQMNCGGPTIFGRSSHPSRIAANVWLL